MTNITTDLDKLKILVVIASYGDKQIGYLKKVIETFKGMAPSVDVVVTSNNSKDLGKDVKVIVGVPSENPMSLPFAHKQVFADNADRYDLFIYDEDDVLAPKSTVEAYLRATRVLPEDQIAGHLRFEMNKAGKMCIPDIFGPYHWKPDSVKVHGEQVFAEFNNEHTGFYILTQAQLKRAIKSGGYLREPYIGRYGMLETAATDPFTSCGFKKVLCISHIDDFLVHHMPNKYAEKSGVLREVLDQQIAVMMSIQKWKHPVSSLCHLESKMPAGWWSKNFYEKPLEELIALAPPHAKSILSIGCGWGATEGALKRNGTSVTALPVDSIIGALAAQRGIEVIYENLENGLKKLSGRKFDCVMVNEMLHLLPEPEWFMEKCLGLLNKGGTLLISGPNFSRLPFFVKRMIGHGNFGKLSSYKESGINVCGPRTIGKLVKGAGLRVTAIKWINHQLPTRRLAKVQKEFGRLTAKDWIVQAK